MTAWQPTTQQEYLAQMIADSFGEPEKLALYLTCCRKYPLDVVERAYADARSVPEAEIKKSRAAVFFYLVKTYAHRS